MKPAVSKQPVHKEVRRERLQRRRTVAAARVTAATAAIAAATTAAASAASAVAAYTISTEGTCPILATASASGPTPLKPPTNPQTSSGLVQQRGDRSVAEAVVTSIAAKLGSERFVSGMCGGGPAIRTVEEEDEEDLEDEGSEDDLGDEEDEEDDDDDDGQAEYGSGGEGGQGCGLQDGRGGGDGGMERISRGERRQSLGGPGAYVRYVGGLSGQPPSAMTMAGLHADGSVWKPASLERAGGGGGGGGGLGGLAALGRGENEIHSVMEGGSSGSSCCGSSDASGEGMDGGLNRRVPTDEEVCKMKSRSEALRLGAALLTRMSVRSVQTHINGYNGIWIVKPGSKSRGRGIRLFNEMTELLTYTTGGFRLQC